MKGKETKKGMKRTNKKKRQRNTTQQKTQLHGKHIKKSSQDNMRRQKTK